MHIIVSKFGGSSTADAGMFRRLRRIISECHERRYIVLSAPGVSEDSGEKITNLLYECHRLQSEGRDFSLPLKKITDRFSAIARGIGIADISGFAEEEILRGLRLSKDHAASRGEYLCALLFSRWTGIPMVDAADLIFFDEGGALDKDATRSAIARMKYRYSRAVIPGFYGAMPDGSLRTFPRNGSDITGALIAAGTGADLYENWSDVDGFMSADPSIVSNARFTPALSYRQMHALSNAGAKILHPDCLSPVSKAGIPTLLKNTFDPDGPGTLISDAFERTVPCLTGRGDYLYLKADDPSARSLPQDTDFSSASDRNGRKYILMRREDCPCPEAFSKIGCVCVFGATEKTRRRLLDTTEYLFFRETEDALCLFVPPEAVNASIKELHGILFPSG